MPFTRWVVASYAVAVRLRLAALVDNAYDVPPEVVVMVVLALERPRPV